MGFNDVMNTIKSEASDAAKITKIKSKIAKERTSIKDSYQKIGEFIYNKYSETGEVDPDLVSLMETITKAKANINEYNLEIDNIKMK